MADTSAEDAAVEQLKEAGLVDEPTNGALPLEDLDFDNASPEMKRLLTQVDRDVHGWKPQPGDKVFGTLVDITDSEGGQYGQYVILTLETPSGNLVGIHCFHTVLRNIVERKLARNSLQTGDEVAIAFRGQKPGTDTYMYRFANRRPTTD